MTTPAPEPAPPTESPVQQFTDERGALWSLRLTVAALQRCVDLAGVNLAEAVDGDLLDRLALDPLLLVNVLCAVLRPQLTQANVTDEEFAERLGPERIDDAAAALIGAIAYFFRRRRGGIVGKILTKKRQVEALALAEVSRAIDSGVIEQKVREHLEATLGPLSGAARES